MVFLLTESQEGTGHHKAREECACKCVCVCVCVCVSSGLSPLFSLKYFLLTYLFFIIAVVGIYPFF
jgi:hypothetical protein